jgi:glycosyltransferase involved in cell wall biosynthesis
VTPLRWLLLATHVPAGGSLGGVVRYTTELLQALVRRDDVEVSVLAAAPAADTLREVVGDARRVHVVPQLPTPVLSMWERRGRMPVGDPPFDVVHGVKHLLPHRSRALRVLTVHDMVLLDRPADFPVLKRVLLPPAYRASLRDADVLVSVSEATRRRLAAYDPAAAGRTAVVPLATAPPLVAAAPVPVPALEGRRFALVVGDSSPRKNLSTVVDAWPEVLRSVPDAVLAIAGPPSWGRSVSGERHAALADAGALVALGRVDDARLRWCYEHATVVLCPSLAEGFGLPAAEALDLGAPLVVSDDPALQEVAAGRALAVVPAADRAGWARAIASALAAGRPEAVPHRRRTWDDVADETVRAVVRAQAARSGDRA